MAHVLAKHASIREDQARQAAVVTRVVTDMSNDPDLTALALAKTKLTMASFSRAQEFEADGIGVGISARAKFDPYGASRFLNAMERNAAMKAGKTSLDPRTQDFLSSHPATPERVQNARNSARQYSSPGERRARPRDLSRRDRQPRLWRRPQRRFCPRPALPASEARLHLCRARYLHARQHRAGGDRRARGRHPGDALRRGARAGRAVADRLSQFRLDGECRQGLHRGSDHQRLPRRVRHRAWRPVAVQGLCAALRQRRLPLHLRRQAEDHRERPQRARDRQLVPPPDAERNPGRASAAHQGHHRAARRHRGIRSPTACPASTAPPSGFGS